jgi:hypothetical protein
MGAQYPVLYAAYRYSDDLCHVHAYPPSENGQQLHDLFGLCHDLRD